jgi:hydrogenase maturation factor HypF (carbamoyltransferase family)
VNRGNGMNEQNLKPFTKENAKEMQKRSVEKRKENKTMREIYEEVIANKKNEIVKALNKGIEEGNLATLKELREGTDGNKINLSGTVKTEMESTEERIKAFESIVGK